MPFKYVLWKCRLLRRVFAQRIIIFLFIILILLNKAARIFLLIVINLNGIIQFNLLRCFSVADFSTLRGYYFIELEKDILSLFLLFFSAICIKEGSIIKNSSLLENNVRRKSCIAKFHVTLQKCTYRNEISSFFLTYVQQISAPIFSYRDNWSRFSRKTET